MLWSCKSDVYLQSPSPLREHVWTRNHRKEGCPQGASLHLDGYGRRFPKGAEAFHQILLNLQGLVWVVKECYWNVSGAFPPWKMHPASAKFQQGQGVLILQVKFYVSVTRLLPQAARVAQQGQNKIQVPAVASQVCWIPRKTCCHPFKQNINRLN